MFPAIRPHRVNLPNGPLLAPVDLAQPVARTDIRLRIFMKMTRPRWLQLEMRRRCQSRHRQPTVEALRVLGPVQRKRKRGYTKVLLRMWPEYRVLINFLRLRHKHRYGFLYDVVIGIDAYSCSLRLPQISRFRSRRPLPIMQPFGFLPSRKKCGCSKWHS